MEACSQQATSEYASLPCHATRCTRWIWLFTTIFSTCRKGSFIHLDTMVIWQAAGNRQLGHAALQPQESLWQGTPHSVKTGIDFRGGDIVKDTAMKLRFRFSHDRTAGTPKGSDEPSHNTQASSNGFQNVNDVGLGSHKHYLMNRKVVEASPSERRSQWQIVRMEVVACNFRCRKRNRLSQFQCPP